MNPNLSDIYITFPVDGEIDKNILTSIEPNITFQTYIEQLESEFKYECKKGIDYEINRLFLGEYKFACITDEYKNCETDNCLVKEEYIQHILPVYLYLTTHENSGLNLFTMIIPQNIYDITFIEDQMSTAHMYISENNQNKYYNLDEVIVQKFNFKRVSQPKCIVCLKEKPSDEIKFGCMLAAEAYGSKQVDYHQTSKEIQEIIHNNISQYGFYEAYVSSKCLVYIFDSFEEDYRENLSEEVEIIFICEFIMFQNAAISRTNRRIVKELTNENKVSLKNIEELYIEFGKTILFWNMDNFKYLLPQYLSNKILEAFKTAELLEDYRRNQSHLEHIVELKSSQATEREGKVINIIAIILAVIQLVPIVIEFIPMMEVLESPLMKIFTVSLSGLISVLLVIYMAKRINLRKKKRITF